jgi:hypothetical protein
VDPGELSEILRKKTSININRIAKSKPTKDQAALLPRILLEIIHTTQLSAFNPFWAFHLSV